MNLKILKREANVILGVGFVVLGLLISYALVASAQTGPGELADGAEALGITFPVPELGNCNDKDRCRAYCDAPEHMAECISFAEKHGLMSKKEADMARRFGEEIRTVKGPGGCDSPGSCEAYCSDISNIDECISFAEEHGFIDDRIEEARRIRDYLEAGGKTPGGCTSEDSCEVYCSDFNNFEECFEFAEKAGLDIERKAGEFERGPRPSKEQMKKIMGLMKRGETPGGCKSKNECEAYCGNADNFEECVAFGEKVGFIDRKEAELIRKTGGKGPGGCNSKESCEAYCNNPDNQESCFKFAEEHGLIPKEELEHIKEGFVRLRQGIEQAPPEVAECLKTTLGPNIIEDIQAGKLTPGPEIGDRVRSCFERFGRASHPLEVLNNAPPEIVACIKEKLGSTLQAVQSGKMMMTPEMGDSFRVCFEQFELQRGPGGGFGGGGSPPPQEISNFIRSAPPAIAECLKAKLGGEFEKIGAGEFIPGPEIGEAMMSCFQSFRPESAPGMMPGVGGEPSSAQPIMPPGVPSGGGYGASGLEILGNLPPEVLMCVKSTVGFDMIEKLQRGELTPERIKEQVFICHEKAGTTPYTPPTSVYPGEQKVCIQVITPAYNPSTGECKEFPTPCDVPAGWAGGCPPGSAPSIDQPQGRIGSQSFLGTIYQSFKQLLNR